jgi:hypothetical protein
MTKLKMAASAQDGTVSRSLFLHLLPLETEETTCKKEMLTVSAQPRQMIDRLVYHESNLQSNLPHAPTCL